MKKVSNVLLCSTFLAKHSNIVIAKRDFVIKRYPVLEKMIFKYFAFIRICNLDVKTCQSVRERILNQVEMLIASEWTDDNVTYCKLITGSNYHGCTPSILKRPNILC